MEDYYDIEIKAFGKRLREIRTEKGMSQVDMEVASGIPQAEISKIERGLRNIEFMTIVKLASAAKVKVSIFFTEV